MLQHETGHSICLLQDCNVGSTARLASSVKFLPKTCTNVDFIITGPISRVSIVVMIFRISRRNIISQVPARPTRCQAKITIRTKNPCTRSSIERSLSTTKLTTRTGSDVQLKEASPSRACLQNGLVRNSDH